MSGTTELPIMLFVFFLVWLFWNSIIMYPIKLLTTLFHEAAHAIAIKLSKGTVGSIIILPKGKGFTFPVKWGSKFLVLNSGYLGSLLIGSFFFWLTYTRLADYALIIMGIFVLVLAVIWIKDWHTLGFSCIVSAILIYAGACYEGVILRIISRFVGVCCVLYSFVIIRYVYEYAHSKRGSDSEQLQAETKIPSLTWASLWCIVSLVVLCFLARLMLTGSLFGWNAEAPV